MSDATAWLRGVVESATPGEWRVDDDECGTGVGPFRYVEHEADDWPAPDTKRAAADRVLVAALHNVAPELLACVDELAAVRDEALATLAHYRARATGGQLLGSPRMNVSTAIAIERDTRSVEALAAKVRACMEASHG